MATNKRREEFIRKVPTAVTPTQAAREVGYKDPQKAAYRLMNDERIAKRVNALVDTGLDALERIATDGKNEIAVATAAKTLVETGLGKPKDNKQSNFGDVTINIAKIDPQMLKELTSATQS